MDQEGWKPFSSSMAACSVRATAEGAPRMTAMRRLFAAGGGGDQIEPGRADEAGLHAIRARVAVDEAVVVAIHHLAEAHGRNAEQRFLLREMVDQRARQYGEVAGRGDLARIGQAVGIVVVRARHAEPLGGVVHLLDEGGHGAAHAFGDDHGHVVGRLHHEHAQGILQRELGARLEAHLARLLRGGERRDGQKAVEADAPFLHRVQRHIDGHQLGDGGRIPGLAGILLLQHAAGIGFHTGRGGIHARPGGAEQRGRGQEAHQRATGR